MKLAEKVVKGAALILALLLSLCSCAKASESDEEENAIGRRFSPFFSKRASDKALVGLISPPLLTHNESGEIICNAISAPTDISVDYDEESDKTSYIIKIRDDICFSDGTKMTSDDVIFTLYVLLDPSYTGKSPLCSVDIKGLDEYRLQLSAASLEKYGEIFDGVSTGVFDNGEYSREEINEVNSASDKAWAKAVRDIVEYVAQSYGTDDLLSEYFTGTANDLSNERFRIAYAMVATGFARFSNGTLTSTEKIGYNVEKGELPDLSDFISCTKSVYNNNLRAFADAQTKGICENPYRAAKREFARNYSKAQESSVEEIKRIEGIKRLSKTQVEITTNGYDVRTIDSICEINIAPLHYYGDKGAYSYEHDRFGFKRGELDDVFSKSAKPLGWGPYRFDCCNDGEIFLKASENYYKGVPEVSELRFRLVGEAIEPIR